MESLKKTVNIGSKEWEPYEKQMRRWFKSWDAVSQANWIFNNPEDYVKYNNEIRDTTLCILNNKGFNFAKYRNRLLTGR